MTWDSRCLSDLLTLHPVAPGHFRNRWHDRNVNGRAFGGQILGQTLAAALGMVTERAPTSLQLLFLQGGEVDQPIDFTVTALQDGKRFSSRHVRASQGERIICDAHASFQQPGAGIEYERPLDLDVPEPDALPSLGELRERYAGTAWSISEKPCLSMHLVDHEQHLFEAASAPQFAYWLKLKQPLRGDASEHYAALAYLSDYWFSTTSLTAHAPMAGIRGRFYLSSLNHSLWFHRPCRADEWLLVVTDNISTAMGRGLCMARFYDRQRRHLATATQECLIAPERGVLAP